MRRESWVSITRNGSLLLALPLDRRLAMATLSLYQPQRWKGRLLCAALKISIFSGIYKCFPRIEMALGDKGLFAGLDKVTKATKSGKLGFLLGSPDSESRNLIGLYGVDSEPCIVKVGVGSGAVVVQREYEVMQQFSSILSAVPECRGRFEIDWGIAYVAEWVRGSSPRGDEDDLSVWIIVSSWLDQAVSTKVSDLACWGNLAESLDAEEYSKMESLANQVVLSPVMHGDFAPWNIKMTEQGDVKVLDWESADPSGMPGWDVIHYQVQRMCLVDSKSPKEVIALCREFLLSDVMKDYLSKAGLRGHEEALLGSYLYYTGRVQSYPREDLIEAWGRYA